MLEFLATTLRVQTTWSSDSRGLDHNDGPLSAWEYKPTAGLCSQLPATATVFDGIVLLEV